MALKTGEGAPARNVGSLWKLGEALGDSQQGNSDPLLQAKEPSYAKKLSERGTEDSSRPPGTTGAPPTPHFSVLRTTSDPDRHDSTGANLCCFKPLRVVTCSKRGSIHQLQNSYIVTSNVQSTPRRPRAETPAFFFIPDSRSPRAWTGGHARDHEDSMFKCKVCFFLKILFHFQDQDISN